MDCFYCGKPVARFSLGWLLRSHAECRALHKAGQQQLSRLIQDYIRGNTPSDQLGRKVRTIAKTHFLAADECKALAIAGVNVALHEHQLSKEEEQKLSSLMSEFGLSQTDIGDYAERLVKVRILRDLDDGTVKQRVQIKGVSGVNLRNEVVLWVFNNVKLHEYKSPPWADKQDSNTQVLVWQDEGFTLITDKNVYFSGSAKNMRIPLPKIVSVQDRSDGIELTREAANPKPLIFVLDDPWFARNLILKLGALSH